MHHENKSGLPICVPADTVINVMPGLKKQLFRFGVVGGAGFAADAGLVTVFYKLLGFNPLLSRVISISVAITVTVVLHRHWAFNVAQAHSFYYQQLSYLVTQGIGQALNFAIYAVLIGQGMIWQTWPFLAVASGSIAAMMVTFSLSKWWVFRPC